jgi:hypothetical protein
LSRNPRRAATAADDRALIDQGAAIREDRAGSAGAALATVAAIARGAAAAAAAANDGAQIDQRAAVRNGCAIAPDTTVATSAATA